MRLSRTFLAIGFCLLLLVSLAAVAQTKRSRAARPTKIQPAVAKPVVAAINTDGLKGLLTEAKERPLLVNFWATWCDPCRDEFPDLVKIDEEYRPHSLDFVTVSLDDLSEIKTEVPKFLDLMKAKMPAYLLNATDPEPRTGHQRRGSQMARRSPGDFSLQRKR
jgi:thiol-disulfide isomerase/thioredoxin